MVSPFWKRGWIILQLSFCHIFWEQSTFWMVVNPQPAGEQLLQFLFQLHILTAAPSLRRRYSVTGQLSWALVYRLTRAGHHMLFSSEKRMLGKSSLLLSGNLQITKAKHERAPIQTLESPEAANLRSQSVKSNDITKTPWICVHMHIHAYHMCLCECEELWLDITSVKCSWTQIWR